MEREPEPGAPKVLAELRREVTGRSQLDGLLGKGVLHVVGVIAVRSVEGFLVPHQDRTGAEG
jgi:hypothetical protein